MRLTISTDLLKALLATVAPVIPAKPTLPVIATVLLQAKGGSLHATGTNMDQSILSSAACSVDEPFSLCVSARLLLSLARELPSGYVTLSAQKDRLTVEHSNGKSSLAGMSHQDYPLIAPDVEGATVPLTGDLLGRLIDTAGFSTASDRTRLQLTGAFLEVADGRATLTSTDGHRLSTASVALGWTDGAASAILPAETMNFALKLAAASQLQCVVLGRGACAFHFEDAMLLSKLIDGPYPNWRQVMPASHTKTYTGNTDDLAKAVRRVALLSNAVTHLVKFSFDSGGLTVSALNMDIGGESRETVFGSYEGEPFEIGMNAAFVGEILRHVSTDAVTLKMTESHGACIFEGEENSRFLCMPLRLNE